MEKRDRGFGTPKRLLVRCSGKIDGFSFRQPIRTLYSVDKKAKKRLEVINKKLQTLRPRLSGSRAQADDAEELKQLEDEIAKLEPEVAELKAK